MTMLSTCFSPRLLPLAGLAVGVLTAAAQEQPAITDSWDTVSVELVTPKRVPQEYRPEFLSALYAHPIQTVQNDAPDFWILRNVETRTSLETVGEGEAASDVERRHYFGRYDTWNSGTRRVSETGVLAWQLRGEDTPSITAAGTIGFMRANFQRPSAIATEPVTGVFTDATGTISWALKQVGARTAVINLQGAAYAPGQTFDDFFVFNVAANGTVTVPSFRFPVPGQSPLREWRFGSSTPQPMGNGHYVSVLRRSDGLTAAQLKSPATLPAGVSSPEDFWSENYLLVLKDENDADRDGIPDFADLSQSIQVFPWYADFDTGANWYYATWMPAWIHADRQLSPDWDYHLNLGWIHVPLSSSRGNFWTYVHAATIKTQAARIRDQEEESQQEDPPEIIVENPAPMGWLLTADGYYPAFAKYVPATTEVPENSWEVLLLMVERQTDSTAVFYNYTYNRFETVQF